MYRIFRQYFCKSYLKWAHSCIVKEKLHQTEELLDLIIHLKFKAVIKLTLYNIPIKRIF